MANDAITVSLRSTREPYGEEPVQVEIFPKVLSEFLYLSSQCEGDCSCLGLNPEHIENSNRRMVDTVRTVLEENSVLATIHIYQFSSTDDQSRAIERLSALLDQSGFPKFEANPEGFHMLELITPVVAIGEELCSFATYPTRAILQEALAKKVHHRP